MSPYPPVMTSREDVKLMSKVGALALVVALFGGACGFLTTDEIESPANAPAEEDEASGEPTPEPTVIPRVDPDDVVTELDIRTVDASLSGDTLTVSLETYDGWSERIFRNPDNEMWIYINTRSEGEFNYYAYFEYDKRLVCQLHEWDGVLIKTFPANKPSAESVSCDIPSKFVDDVAIDLRWSASSHAAAGGGARSKDVAPDSGYHGE